MKITRKNLERIIKEELLREQQRYELDNEEYKRAVKYIEQGLSFADAVKRAKAELEKLGHYQPREKSETEPGIRNNEEGMMTSYGERDTRSPTPIYTHRDVRKVGGRDIVVSAPGEQFDSSIPEYRFKDGGAPTRPSISKPKAKPKTSTSEVPAPESETQTNYQPKPWTDDRAWVDSSIKARWFPKFAKDNLTPSKNGAYVELVKDSGQGVWYASPDMGGLRHKYEGDGKSGWGWWKFSKSGGNNFALHYTPKTPGGRVADFNDPSDPDIGRVSLELSANLPTGYSINSFNLDNMFYRFQGQTGLGLEGDISLSGEGRLQPDVDSENKQKNRLAQWAEHLKPFLQDIFAKGSSSMTLQVPVEILGMSKKIPVTLSAG